MTTVRYIKTALYVIFIILIASTAYAGQSTILVTEGYACMGDDKSKKQTENGAVLDAKKNAIENVKTYVTSEMVVKNFELEKDLAAAYSNALVNVIETIEKGWYKDQSSGDCYKVKLKVEVVPDDSAMKQTAQKNQEALKDPTAPLNVEVWTDKQEYQNGQKIKILLRGNKPFYARVIYKDANGNMVQLLPNPYRQDNYFNGGIIYELPSGNDRFDLQVSPPFGSENVIVYSSTSQLGQLNLTPAGGVYSVNTPTDKVSKDSRGVILQGKDSFGNSPQSKAEFSENNAVVKTGR